MLLRHYMGEDLESLSLKEIQNLEQQLDTGLKNIRAKKNQLLHESISELQKKEYLDFGDRSAGDDTLAAGARWCMQTGGWVTIQIG
ncbi:hypothetical protein M8C21_029685 [Ambrosia artemisiifolia]|uniref:K-box domain-containing protein n=1 Tax=Ambrosia artemisiifolia TaxID=4212 RepID=A0AAD5G257_AMBAR|nr:hypothetical protein M8C21_029685 [Ambrosia artemisiifolia]